VLHEILTKKNTLKSISYGCFFDGSVPETTLLGSWNHVTRFLKPRYNPHFRFLKPRYSVP